MKIRKVKLFFSNKIESFPSDGIFGNGLNVLYSEKNNKGKTTVLRSIMRTFFSNSIVLPIPLDKERKVIKISVEFEHNNKIYFAVQDLETGILESNISGEEEIYEDKNYFLQQMYMNFPSSKEIRASLFGASIYLDQDHDYDDKSLWPTLWQNKGSLNNARYFLYANPTNISFKTFEDVSKDFKNELRKINNKIEFIKSIMNDDLTNDAGYDIEQIDKRIQKSKDDRRKYKKTIKEIEQIKTNIFNLELLTKKQNKRQETNDFVYVNAIDPKTKENISVMVDIDRLINFHTEPLDIISKDANDKIKLLNDRLKSLRNVAKKFNSLEIESIVSNKIDHSFDYSELIKRRKEVKDFLEKSLEDKKQFDAANLLLKKEVKKMNEKLNFDSINYRKNFSQFDSNSGSDKFATKVSNYMAFVTNVKAIDFPIIIDSFKEKDFSHENQEKLLKLIFAIADSKNIQAFVTATNPEHDLIKKYKSTEIK